MYRNMAIWDVIEISFLKCRDINSLNSLRSEESVRAFVEGNNLGLTRLDSSHQIIIQIKASDTPDLHLPALFLYPSAQLGSVSTPHPAVVLLSTSHIPFS